MELVVEQEQILLEIALEGSLFQVVGPFMESIIIYPQWSESKVNIDLYSTNLYQIILRSTQT